MPPFKNPPASGALAEPKQAAHVRRVAIDEVGDNGTVAELLRRTASRSNPSTASSREKICVAFDSSEIVPHAKAILDAAVDLLGQDALIVIWRGLANIPDADLAEIGFRKIAGTELICRQSTLRSRFSEKYPRGQDVDVVGRPEFEPWVLEQWQKEELD